MYSDESDECSRPITPSEDDCCHNGCDPCIFDIHEKLLITYEKRKGQKIRHQNKKNVLCLSSYKSFSIVDIQEASESYVFLFLKYHEDNLSDDRSILINPGQHVMLHLNDTTKPFTPISYTHNTIQFLIKLYPNGKFSTNLKNAKIGYMIRARGPYGDFKYEFNSFQTIVMFSIGSGIAAVYPVAKSIIDNELEETKIHLVAGFQNVSQVPLKRELQLLSDYWNFKCTLHLSRIQSNSANIHGLHIKIGKLEKGSVSEILKNKTANTTLILICGTHEFNDCVEQWVHDINYTHIHIFK